MPLTWELGAYAGQGGVHIAAYVSLVADPEKLQEAAISLVAQRDTPFFLLVPSRDLCSVQLANTAEKAGIYLLGLDELINGPNSASSGDLLGKYVCPGQSAFEEENIFRLEKEHWRVIFRGRPYTIRQSVGIQYITCLIWRAYNDEPEIHVSDLFYLVHKQPPIKDVHLSKMSSGQLSELGLDVAGLGEGLDLMTREGKQWLANQVRALEALIEEAEATGNTREALEMRAKREALEDHIKKAFGLAGRTRKASDPNERIRKSVSKAIGNTLERFGKQEGDELAVYLDDHLSTGLFCSFSKDPNIFWKVMKN